MCLRISVLLGCLAACSATRATVPDPHSTEQILARYEQALGGAPAIDRVRSRSTFGCYLPTRETPCVPFEVHARAPYAWKTVMTSPGILRLEQLNTTDAAWTQMSDEKEELSTARRLDLELAFNYHVAVRPAQHFSGMMVSGCDASGCITEARRQDGTTVDLHFDAKTALLTRMGNYFFKDYASIDGVMTPRTVEHAKTGVRYTFKTIVNNTDLPDTAFEPAGNLAGHLRTKHAMRRAALAEALTGIDVTEAERQALEALEFFSPHEGRLLFNLIRQRRYRRGLEIGTAWGNSAIWMAMAFKRNGGKLITIELRPEFAERARKNFTAAGLDAAVDSRVNDAFKEIPQIAGEFDLVFMDTGTNLHARFLDQVYSRVTPGGAIISHNADTFERDQPDFRKAVMEDPELETSLMLTPGGGMSVSIRRPRT